MAMDSFIRSKFLEAYEKTEKLDYAGTEKCTTQEGEAMVQGSIRRYDATNIVYEYVVGNIEYWFAFETDYDELHRALGKKSIKTWYDGIESFKIEYCKDNPKIHKVLTEKYTPINKRAFFICDRKEK